MPLEAAMELLHQGMDCDTTSLSAYIWALTEAGALWLELGLSPSKIANESSSWSSALPSAVTDRRGHGDRMELPHLPGH